jgi:hypothetical protein
VRSVESELNEAGRPPSETVPAAAPDTVATGAVTAAPPAAGEETPRQTALPGFDRI